MTDQMPPVGTLFIDSRDGAICQVLFYDVGRCACMVTYASGRSVRDWWWYGSGKDIPRLFADFTYIEVDRETYDVIADMYRGGI